MAAYYEALQLPKPEENPWTPLRKPVEQRRFALGTTAARASVSRSMATRW